MLLQECDMKNPVIKKAISICGSQVKLSQLCGVSQVTISHWLNGGGIKAKHIKSISNATNGKISTDEILQSLVAHNLSHETRNELTKNARAIADLIYRKSASRKHKGLARLIGQSESQFSRTFSQNVEMVAVLIDELGIQFIDAEELRALQVLARKSLEK